MAERRTYEVCTRRGQVAGAAFALGACAFDTGDIVRVDFDGFADRATYGASQFGS